MKVLKKSDLEKPWKSTVKCTGDKTVGTKSCGAEFEISEDDIKFFHYFGTHFQHEYYSVKCPICGEIVQKFDIPQYVIDRWKKSHPKSKSEFDGFDDRI